MKNLSHHMVLRQQQHLVISPWSLMATVLVQNRDGITVKALIKEVEWLKRQCYNLGTYLDWPGMWLKNIRSHFIVLLEGADPKSRISNSNACGLC